MTEEEENKATDELLATIGQYVITFQWIESKIEECLKLWWGHENWEKSQLRLSDMTNNQKVKALLDEFRTTPGNERGRSRPDWVAVFESLVDRLHDERRRRNRLVHSHYLFDFLKIGAPILQIDPKEGAVDLSTDAQKRILREISELAMSMGFAYTQIIHDHWAPTQPAAANAT